MNIHRKYACVNAMLICLVLVSRLEMHTENLCVYVCVCVRDTHTLINVHVNTHL